MKSSRLQFFAFIVLSACTCSFSASININGNLTFATVTHAYILHVPPTYTNGSATPLVVSLHGYTWAIADYMGVDNLSATSDTAGFLLVYPQGQNDSWDSGPFCCGGNTLDDVGFIRSLVDTLCAHYTIDKNRIYAVGTSNGAMMANRLGAQASDVFAAVCGVAGPLALSSTDSELNPSRPVPVLDFHALDDGTVPYAGGFGGGAPAETVAVAKWASVDGCTNGPVSTVANGKTAVETWTKPNSSIEVLLYTTQDGGHWWPPSYADPNNTIWNFFKRHTKPLPFVNLSDSLITVVYTMGQSWPVVTKKVAAVNPIASMTGPITVSKKSSWLTCSVDATKLDSQVITNTIDPSSLPATPAKYYDTVVAHSPGSGIPDLTYRVLVWVGTASALSSIIVSPASVTVPAGQKVQFSATAFDQYNLSITPQPTITWNTSSGTITAAGLLTAGDCAGSATASASSSGIIGTAAVTQTALNNARIATVTASTQVTSGPASAMIDGAIIGYPVDPSKEWSSNGEKAGAWAQLTWASPVSIDSIALWDRPNADDQVLSGTLAFSDGSNISVGMLPNDASAPWSQKFSARIVSWVKFTINTVSTSTANVGLAEFQAFSTAACSVTLADHGMEARQTSGETLSATPKGISVHCAGDRLWTLELYTLSGARMAVYSGKGSALVSLDRNQQTACFAVAKLRSGTTECIVKIPATIQ